MSAPCPTLGFVVRATLRDATDPTRANALVESLDHVLESNDLANQRVRPLEFEITRDGSQATHADRELLFQWAEGWSDVARIEISDIVDLGRR
jgi:hypothetical protein